MLLAAGLGVPESGVRASGFAHCPPDQAPRFVLGFADLKRQVGVPMGEPVTCEYTDPEDGHAWQFTTTGVAFLHGTTGVLTFTAGYRHWSLTRSGLLYWDGGAPSGASQTRQSPAAAEPYPLNGRFLLLNMHGALFHEPWSDMAENIAYARWMGAGVIRVFATDSNSYKPWSGREVGGRIVQAAPLLRTQQLKLLVALVNNHQPVPGEAPENSGWVDGYKQLLLPFYTHAWRGAYLTFVRELISTVRAAGAQDVIQAWEIGNEIHTPDSPGTLVSFVLDVVSEIRALDPFTPIYPGTMGANHLQPWNSRSPIARWLYCQAPLDAYTLHAYDWVSRDRSGDMPIEWDLDAMTAEPCPSGRKLPVIVEELGTSRALPGVYNAEQEQKRLEQEVRQLRFVLSFPQVKGVGVWNAESPRVRDRTFYDHRRGLTSYGPRQDGGGSCYDPAPLPQPGVRCQLERILQALPHLP